MKLIARLFVVQQCGKRHMKVSLPDDMDDRETLDHAKFDDEGCRGNRGCCEFPL